jgi:hypothetical protein
VKRLPEERPSLITGARYTDGAPVIFGPFGGDDLLPVEKRLSAFAQAYRSRSRWRKLLGRGIDEKTRAEIDRRYPLAS